MHLNRVHVDASSIAGAGKGLFASQKILAGEVFTCYPGDALLFRSASADDSLDVLFGEHVPSHRRDASRVAASEARAYEIPTRHEGAPVGLVGDPELAHQPAYLGHMVNDCATLTSSAADSVAQYALTAAKTANAAHVPVEGCHMASIALKDIEEGEEVTCSYGPRYWLSRLGCTVSEMQRAELDLGVELRRGGDLSREMLPLMARPDCDFPAWILDCFERSRNETASKSGQ